MDDALLAALLEGLPRRLFSAFFFLGCCCSSVCLRHSLPRAGLKTRPYTTGLKGPVLHCLFLRDRALARTLARARVGARPLTAHRQVAPVPQATVAADLHQPLDIHRDLLAEIAFHAALLFEHAADLPDIVFGEILDPDVGAHARRTQHVVRALASNAVDVGKADLNPLGPREIHTCNTRHRLPLSLLVLRVGADHAHHAAEIGRPS